MQISYCFNYTLKKLQNEAAHWLASVDAFPWAHTISSPQRSNTKSRQIILDQWEYIYSNHRSFFVITMCHKWFAWCCQLSKRATRTLKTPEKRHENTSWYARRRCYMCIINVCYSILTGNTWRALVFLYVNINGKSEAFKKLQPSGTFTMFAQTAFV